jgi:hypothetical protein
MSECDLAWTEERGEPATREGRVSGALRRVGGPASEREGRRAK